MHVVALLHQKGALSYGISYRTNPELSKRVPPDTNQPQEPIMLKPKNAVGEMKHISFSNADDFEGVMRFDSDSFNLCLDSCATVR